MVIIVSRMISNIGITENRSLQIGFLIIFLSSFLSANFIYSINTMRYIVTIIFISLIIPYSITFLLTWSYIDDPNITRIQYVTYICWILTLIFILFIRLLFGWGTNIELFSFILYMLILSVLDGILGAVASVLMINIIEKNRNLNYWN